MHSRGGVVQAAGRGGVRVPARPPSGNPREELLTHLQQTAGNAAVARVVQRDFERRQRSGAADLRDRARLRSPYVDEPDSKLAGHAERASGAEAFGGAMADGGAAGLLTAEPTANTKRDDTKSSEGGAGLWMAAGAGDVLAGPAAFIGGLHAFRDKHASIEDRVMAVFGMTSAVTQTVGGGATAVNAAFNAAGQAADKDLKSPAEEGSASVRTLGKTVKTAEAGDDAKSEQRLIADDTGWNMPAFVQDFVSGLKGSIETILKFKEVHASRKNKDDSKATTARLFFDATTSFLSSIKSIVSGARYVLKFLGSGAADALASYAIPGVGLAVNAAHLIVKIFQAVKAAAKRAAMKVKRNKLLESVLGADGSLARLRKDKASKQSEEKKHTWRERLRTAAAAGGAAASIIKEYLLADLLQRLAKKRFVRALTTMVPKLSGIVGDILTLSGVGAIAGTVFKGFSSAWELGQTGFRWAKQKVHDRKADHHKSSASKQREYVAGADAIFDQYADLPSRARRTVAGDVMKDTDGKLLRNTAFDLLTSEVEPYVKAAGARPSDLYQAKDMPEAYRLLIKAMKDR